jgi:hypothetical protein
MNRRPQWAKDHVPLIAKKLRREAKRRGLWGVLARSPGAGFALQGLVTVAIQRWEEKQQVTSG